MAHKTINVMIFRIASIILVSVILSSVHAHAALTQNDISMLYVSIFNRASEGEGNAYWRNRADLQTMAEAATAMLDTDAAKNYFGSSLNTNQAFIEHIYLNTLNKSYWDDPFGITYWVGLLNGGKSRGEVVADLVGVIKEYAPDGAYYNPDDPVTIAAYNQFTNRVSVSDYMAVTVQTTPDNWETVTQFGTEGLNVTSETASVDTAKQAINVFSGDSGDPGDPGGGLADDIQYYMTLITSASDLASVPDEMGALLETILAGDTSVVTITPPLANLDLNNLPPNISIRADFGTGFTPEESTAVYTGLAAIDITGISFSTTGITAALTLSATDVRRDGTPVLSGLMTMGIDAGISGENNSVSATVNFSNLTTADAVINGGIAMNIPAISREGQLLQPVTITLNQLTAMDYQLDGTAAMTLVSSEILDIDFNVTTNQGPLTGLLRVEMNPDAFGESTLSTPSGPMTIDDASVIFNQVVTDPSLCEDLPAAGDIEITRGTETATITFSGCAYTIE